MKPTGQNAEVTLLHLHGNAGSLFSQYKFITPFLKHGFQVFIVDYSGFGFSEGKATRNNALEDALLAFDYLRARPDVQNTKLAVYGQSFGGHLSVVVAEKRQADLDGLIVEGAFSSPGDIAASRLPLIGRVLVKPGYSAKRSILTYKRPVLIIHSTEDKVIPFYMGQRLYSKANEPKSFYEIRHSHICGPLYYEEEISQKIKIMLGVYH